jgi:hypothetical protein
MKRDMDILRRVLLSVERNRDEAEYDNTEWYHLELAHQAGLIAGKVYEYQGGGGGRKVMIVDMRLTPDGHNFVDLARHDDIWRGVADSIASTVKTASFDVWCELLRNEQRSRLL